MNTAARPQEYLAQFWRTRVQTALERLEREARRMLQIEAELSQFANDYYAAVGEATERLAVIEEKLSGSALEHDVTRALPDMLVSKDAPAARKAELKTRYRQLAKDIHPDRSALTLGTGPRAGYMQALNSAYHQGDLAAMLKIEAEMLLEPHLGNDLSDTAVVEQSLRELERAADTYAQAYRDMLHSPLNELMLRALSARLAGWDWMQTVVSKIERVIEEKERAAVEAGIAQISQWRQQVQAVA